MREAGADRDGGARRGGGLAAPVLPAAPTLASHCLGIDRFLSRNYAWVLPHGDGVDGR